MLLIILNAKGGMLASMEEVKYPNTVSQHCTSKIFLIHYDETNLVFQSVLWDK